MAKKAKKSMSKAARSARAKASWAARRAAGRGVVAAPMNVTDEVTVVDGLGFITDVNGYSSLAAELAAAYRQSAQGKGKERHANGRAFDRQPIMELTRLYGAGFAAGQAAKKVQEALMFRLRAGETEAAHAEVLGGIVYLAALAAYIRENGLTTPPAAKKK